MSILNNVQLLKRLHDLILRKSTGTPAEFAKKLRISERSMHRILEELRGIGAIIKYDPTRESYYYENDVIIKMMIRIDPSNSV